MMMVKINIYLVYWCEVSLHVQFMHYWLYHMILICICMIVKMVMFLGKLILYMYAD